MPEFLTSPRWRTLEIAIQCYRPCQPYLAFAASLSMSLPKTGLASAGCSPACTAGRQLNSSGSGPLCSSAVEGSLIASQRLRYAAVARRAHKDRRLDDQEAYKSLRLSPTIENGSSSHVSALAAKRPGCCYLLLCFAPPLPQHRCPALRSLHPYCRP